MHPCGCRAALDTQNGISQNVLFLPGQQLFELHTLWFAPFFLASHFSHIPPSYASLVCQLLKDCWRRDWIMVDGQNIVHGSHRNFPTWVKGPSFPGTCPRRKSRELLHFPTLCCQHACPACTSTWSSCRATHPGIEFQPAHWTNMQMTNFGLLDDRKNRISPTEFSTLTLNCIWASAGIMCICSY